MRFLPTAIAAAALLAITPAHGTNIFVTTGTGTETATISEGNPLSWIFTAMPPYTSFQAGVFAMQMEAGTSHGIRLELFDIVNASVVDSVTLSADDVAAAGGNALSYERIVFSLPVAFSSGDRGFLLSVVSSKSECPVLFACNSRSAMFAKILPVATHLYDIATAPDFLGTLSMGVSISSSS